jgi:phosphatidylethanolamine/phosphatidyl-N-methylethanolamine N-methyltransferase
MRKIDPDEYYKNYYECVLRSGIVGWVAEFGHRRIEKAFNSAPKVNQVLELGCGQGQHLKFVKQPVEEYIESDLRLENIPVRDIASKNVNIEKVVRTQLDSEILSPIKSESIDRVIATCLLAHLPNPESALIEWRRVTKQGGSISIWVASEPGLLLRVLRQLTTVRKARRRGLNHLSFLYREHRNHYPYLQVLIRDVFESDHISVRSFPASYMSWNLSLWKIITITKKND